jgi:hypothetical protein
MLDNTTLAYSCTQSSMPQKRRYVLSKETDLFFPVDMEPVEPVMSRMRTMMAAMDPPMQRIRLTLKALRSLAYAKY